MAKHRGMVNSDPLSMSIIDNDGLSLSRAVFRIVGAVFNGILKV